MLVIHKRKQVRLGGLTIPLSSSIVLLLVCVVSITSMLCIYPCCLFSNSVHAEEGDGSSERDTEKNDIDALIHTDNTVNTNTSVTNNISRAVSPSASLTINNGSNVNSSAITTAGDVAYISNDIRVQASDIESYAVQISYASGSNSLSLADGSVVLSGANNTTPTNMLPNTWGYSWSSTNTNPESTTYQTLSTTNTQLSGDSVSNNSIDFTRRLTFVAKFGEGVKAGHYQTSVLLSLSATPKQVITLSKIANMQDMTTSICTESNIGETTTLKDIRDNNTYTIRKHEDGNCWMTSNLRIVNKTLTPDNSDVTSSYTMPATSFSNFSQDDYIAQIYYTANNTYYSWVAATAGTGDTNITIGDAPSSICPKGWKLPPNNGNGSYTELARAANITNNAAGSTKIRSAPYNFSYNGYVNGTLGHVGSEGYYWSRTISSIRYSPFAYRLYIASNYAAPAADDHCYKGFSVRCVAVSQ